MIPVLINFNLPFISDFASLRYILSSTKVSLGCRARDAKPQRRKDANHLYALAYSPSLPALHESNPLNAPRRSLHSQHRDQARVSRNQFPSASPPPDPK